MSFAERTDAEKRRGQQTSKIQDDTKDKRGKNSLARSARQSIASVSVVLLHQKPLFILFRSDLPSIRKPIERASSAPPIPSPAPPAKDSIQVEKPANGENKKLLFKLPPSTELVMCFYEPRFECVFPTERKADGSNDSMDERAAKKPKHESSVDFSFLNKFREESSQIHFDLDEHPSSIPSCPPLRPRFFSTHLCVVKRRQITSLDEFDDYQREYAEKWALSKTLYTTIQQNSKDFTVLANIYNSDTMSNNVASVSEIENKLTEVYRERKETVDKFRRKYAAVHEDLVDLKSCIDLYVSKWVAPQ